VRSPWEIADTEEAFPTSGHLPVIEFVRDGLGTSSTSRTSKVRTGLVLRPDNEVRFECHGRDPRDAQLTWSVITSQASGCGGQESNSATDGS
jgi:hypothetical protein